MASRQEIQTQLNGKLHWNASDFEIRDWLETKYGISGEEADAMIAIAEKDRALTIRKTCLLRAVVSLLVAVPLAGLMWAGLASGSRRMSGWSLILAGTVAACLAYAGKNLWAVVTGSSETSIDA